MVTKIPFSLHDALRLLCYRIEECGASPELTRAVTLCSDIRASIGNKFNPPNPHIAEQTAIKVGLELAAIDAAHEKHMKETFG